MNTDKIFTCVNGRSAGTGSVAPGSQGPKEDPVLSYTLRTTKDVEAWVQELAPGKVTQGRKTQEQTVDIQQGSWTRVNLVLPKMPLVVPFPSTEPSPREAPVPLVAATSEPLERDVIATLGGKSIRYGDFCNWLKVMAGQRSSSLRDDETKRKQAINQYLELQVLAAKGQKENLQSTGEFQATLPLPPILGTIREMDIATSNSYPRYGFWEMVL